MSKKSSDKKSEESKKDSSPQKDFIKLVDVYLNDVLPQGTRTNKELEVRFGTRGKKRLTRIDFDNVIQKLKSVGFKSDSPVASLKINNEFTVPGTGETKISSIRCEINEMNMIQDYCKTNKLVDNPADSVPSMIQFMQKKYKKEGDKTYYPVNFDDMNFRVSYQHEEILESRHGLVKGTMMNWNDSKKIFRYLSRTRFTHSEYPVAIECSIVKNSKSNRGRPIPTYSIQESEVFESDETYEIEIEVNNAIVNVLKMDTKMLVGSLRKCIMTVFVIGVVHHSHHRISGFAL